MFAHIVSRYLSITYRSSIISFLFFIPTAYATSYYWDCSSSTGFQAGDGFWSTNSTNWSTDGTSRFNWPTSNGHNATFTGNSGVYAVDVIGNVNVDSITFLTGSYTIFNGTINLQNKLSLFVDDSISTPINSVINANGTLKKFGNGIIELGGKNNINGQIRLNNGIIRVTEDSALGKNPGNTIIIENGAALDVNGLNLQRYTNSIVINGTLNSTNGALINTGSDQYRAFRKIILGSNASIGNNGGRFDIGRGFEGTDCIDGQGHVLTKIGSNRIALLANATNLDSIAIIDGCLMQESVNICFFKGTLD